MKKINVQLLLLIGVLVLPVLVLAEDSTDTASVTSQTVTTSSVSTDSNSTGSSVSDRDSSQSTVTTGATGSVSVPTKGTNPELDSGGIKDTNPEANSGSGGDTNSGQDSGSTKDVNFPTVCPRVYMPEVCYGDLKDDYNADYCEQIAKIYQEKYAKCNSTRQPISDPKPEDVNGGGTSSSGTVKVTNSTGTTVSGVSGTNSQKDSSVSSSKTEIVPTVSSKSVIFSNSYKDSKEEESQGDSKKSASTSGGVSSTSRQVKEISVEAKASSGVVTISVEEMKTSVMNEKLATSSRASVNTKEKVEIKNDKLFVKDQEVKVMPDTASAIAQEKLGELGFIIELKDTGSEDVPEVTYEAINERQVRILGIFKANLQTKVSIDAESENTKVFRPWWSFLAF